VTPTALTIGRESAADFARFAWISGQRPIETTAAM